MTPATENPAASRDTTTKPSFLKGFFNFDNFITVRLLKIVYAIGFVLIVLAAIVTCLVVAAHDLEQIFVKSSWFPLFENLLRPLFYLALSIIYYIAAGVLALLLLRLYCEFIMVIFKINENIQGLRDQN